MSASRLLPYLICSPTPIAATQELPSHLLHIWPAYPPYIPHISDLNTWSWLGWRQLVCLCGTVQLYVYKGRPIYLTWTPGLGLGGVSWYACVALSSYTSIRAAPYIWPEHLVLAWVASVGMPVWHCPAVWLYGPVPPPGPLCCPTTPDRMVMNPPPPPHVSYLYTWSWLGWRQMVCLCGTAQLYVYKSRPMYLTCTPGRDLDGVRWSACVVLPSYTSIWAVPCILPVHLVVTWMASDGLPVWYCPAIRLYGPSHVSYLYTWSWLGWRQMVCLCGTAQLYVYKGRPMYLTCTSGRDLDGVRWSACVVLPSYTSIWAVPCILPVHLVVTWMASDGLPVWYCPAIRLYGLTITW